MPDRHPGQGGWQVGFILASPLIVRRCQTAIQVKEDGKTVTYYLDDKGMKEEYHEEVCGGARKEGTVTGTVHEHDGKKFIKPTKVEYANK